MRIATRSSALALWQAEHVSGLLRSADSTIEVEIVPVSTFGDRRTDVPLSQIGGKGVFAKEVQAAVLAGEVDIAVHSAKDLPAQTPQGLVVAGVPERGDARDALVGARLEDLGEGDVVATGSARRRVQLAQAVPGIRFVELRGNMATRLAKAEEFSAIVVAAVALERLGLTDRLTEVLDADLIVPQVGQGTLAVECRADDDQTAALLAAITHGDTRRLLECERSFLMELGGDCELPAGAHARMIPGGEMELTGVLSATSTDGPPVQVHRLAKVGDDHASLGSAVAAVLADRVGR